MPVGDPDFTSIQDVSHSLTVDWIKKKYYIHSMEYYSAMWEDEMLLFHLPTKWKEVKRTVCNKAGQNTKADTIYGGYDLKN